MSSALTYHATGRMLLSPIIICYGGYIREYTALWDTGASESAVSERVVSEMQMKSVGADIINTAGGRCLCNKYNVNMVLETINLRNFIIYGFTDLKFDVLIGMDIIENGDFTISGTPDDRCFSFRVPSVGIIDYWKDWVSNRK